MEFAPLTVFFGPNSSGKSSLLQFLLLLKQTKDSADRALTLDFGSQDSSADLGSFRDAVHGHAEEDSISWRLKWQLPNELRIADPSRKRSEGVFRGDEISVASSVKLRNKMVAPEYLEYHFSNARFRLERKADGPEFRLGVRSQENFRFIRTPGRPWDLPGPTKSFAFPDQARTYFQNSQFLSDFEVAYVKQMDRILHLGPLRAFPRRQYVWAGSSPIDVGRNGDRAIDAILAATERQEFRNLRWKSRLKPFQEMIAWWLKEMGLIREFRVEEVKQSSGLYRVFVKFDRNGPEILITDVGFGVSQILPALVLLYYAEEGSTVLLEQPEIHLHPAVQSGLADLILTVVKTRKIQVILESHSEHLLKRLQRRIAEGKNSPYPEITTNDVKIYFCNLSEKMSSLERLNVNLFGGIENWPEKFFGDPIDDIAAREKAAIKRRVDSR